MKKIFLIIFLFFTLPSLSLADDWEPILKIGPILDKDLDLLFKRALELDSQMRINLAKQVEILKLFKPPISNLEWEKIDLEWRKLSNEWERLKLENDILTRLYDLLNIAREDVFIIEILLFYNKNLKGSKIIKDRIKFIIKKGLEASTEIKQKLESWERLGFSNETIEVLNNIRSDLEKALEILK
jgi:hypothetical protein